MSAEPPSNRSIKWNCHSGRCTSSGSTASSATRSCSLACCCPALARGSFSETMWSSSEKLASGSQHIPFGPALGRCQNRGYFSKVACTRSHNALRVMPGLSTQTPTITMRLTALSMRSQAVSTDPMGILCCSGSMSRALAQSPADRADLMRAMLFLGFGCSGAGSLLARGQRQLAHLGNVSV